MTRWLLDIFVYRRRFPDLDADILTREVMEEQYPCFARHRVLVPAPVVYRLGRAVAQPRRVSGELREVKRFKKRK